MAIFYFQFQAFVGFRIPSWTLWIFCDSVVQSLLTTLEGLHPIAKQCVKYSLYCFFSVHEKTEHYHYNKNFIYGMQSVYVTFVADPDVNHCFSSIGERN